MTPETRPEFGSPVIAERSKLTTRNSSPIPMGGLLQIEGRKVVSDGIGTQEEEKAHKNTERHRIEKHAQINRLAQGPHGIGRRIDLSLCIASELFVKPFFQIGQRLHGHHPRVKQKLPVRLPGGADGFNILTGPALFDAVQEEQIFDRRIQTEQAQ